MILNEIIKKASSRTSTRSFYVIVMALLLFLAGTADAHRMLLGYKVNELQLKAMYDDGTPAQSVVIEVLKDGLSILNGTTDDKGEFLFCPQGDISDLTFISSSVGHRAELSLNLRQENADSQMPLAGRVAAGIGYLLGIAGISMIYVVRRKRSA
ncbi:MAG: nickel transport protein [Euryarchaeota archaeon]|nr:nickel transport protein [Euryarchaeota archaeon]